VQALPEGADEKLTGATYGALKALCEREVEARFPGRALQVRAGLIVGPHDPTDRFTWWVRRVARGGEVLAPGDPAGPVQLVDGRDLAAWIVAMAERGAGGVFNATGPATPLTFGATLEACREATGGDARFTWVDEAMLLERGVAPWSDLPLWLPREHAGMVSLDASRARAAGLAFRPLVETARDTWRWDQETPAAARPPKAGLAMTAGMAPEREAELLREWRARR
jgi:2'-hydroxyisoflavone reductase